MKEKLLYFKEKAETFVKTDKFKEGAKKTVLIGAPFVAITGIAYYALKNADDIKYTDFIEVDTD